MNSYIVRLEVPEGEVQAILEELEKAQRVILDCYDRLDKLGVLTVREKESSQEWES